MNPTVIERIIADLLKMADDISSQSLSEIQVKLREAASVIDELNRSAKAAGIVEDRLNDSYFKMTY